MRDRRGGVGVLVVVLVVRVLVDVVDLADEDLVRVVVVLGTVVERIGEVEGRGVHRRVDRLLPSALLALGLALHGSRAHARLLKRGRDARVAREVPLVGEARHGGGQARDARLGVLRDGLAVHLADALARLERAAEGGLLHRAPVARDAFEERDDLRRALRPERAQLVEVQPTANVALGLPLLADVAEGVDGVRRSVHERRGDAGHLGRSEPAGKLEEARAGREVREVTERLQRTVELLLGARDGTESEEGALGERTPAVLLQEAVALAVDDLARAPLELAALVLELLPLLRREELRALKVAVAVRVVRVKHDVARVALKLALDVAPELALDAVATEAVREALHEAVERRRGRLRTGADAGDGRLRARLRRILRLRRACGRDRSRRRSLFRLRRTRRGVVHQVQHRVARVARVGVRAGLDLGRARRTAFPCRHDGRAVEIQRLFVQQVRRLFGGHGANAGRAGPVQSMNPQRSVRNGYIVQHDGARRCTALCLLLHGVARGSIPLATSRPMFATRNGA